MAKAPDESPPIHGPKLIQHNVAVPLLEAAGYPKRVWVTASCHESDQKRTQVAVQLVR